MAKSKGKLRHISIRPAANGYTVEAQHDQGNPGQMAAPYREEQPSVHTSRQSALDHVGKLLAAHEGEPDADDQAPMPMKRGRQALQGALQG